MRVRVGPGQSAHWRIVGFSGDKVSFISEKGIRSTLPFSEFRQLVESGVLVLSARE